MIFDHHSKLSNYRQIPHIDLVVNFLKKENLKALPTGEIKIKGDDLFVKVMEYEPKPEAENKFEAHRKYADIQVLVEGTEKMQVTYKEGLREITAYDSDNDYQFFSNNDNVSDIVVRDGHFIVFFPGEVHKPACRYQDTKQKVKKLVFKTRCN